MIRIFITLILFISYINGSNIDSKISKNKKIFVGNKKQKQTTTIKVSLLAKQINKSTKDVKQLSYKISKLDKTIKNNRFKLYKIKKKLKFLKLEANELLRKKKANQVDIVNNIINNHTSSIAIDLASSHTEDELIDSYIYTILSKDSKKQLLKLDKQYKILLTNQVKNKKKIKNLKKFINKDLNDKKKLNKLEKKYKLSLSNLKLKHKKYQDELRAIIKQQNQLSALLSKLNILKKREIEQERKRRLAKQRALELAKIKRAKAQAALLKKRKLIQKQKQKISKKQANKIVVDKTPIVKETSTQKETKKFNKSIAMDVKSIGSSISGIKIAKYKGVKTISPLEKYTVHKKFGYFYDKVYKIKLFNDSLELKPKKAKSKVRSVFAGKVVFIKRNSGLLGNVIIIKHKNNLHTIYSHLDEIPYSLKKGKWVKKGTPVGRVSEILHFQATKNSKYIDPKDLFKG